MKKIVILLLMISGTAQAYLSRGYNVEQLAQKSDKIFLGEVTDVKESSTNQIGLPYVEISFKVFETFKGNVPGVYTFRQFAPKVGKQFRLLGMSKDAYSVGQKLVMFLGSPGSKGLSAPIDFQLFLLQTKSDRQVDIDKAIVLNQQVGAHATQNLFMNLQNPNVLKAMTDIQSKSKVGEYGVSYQNLRRLIQASLS